MAPKAKNQKNEAMPQPKRRRVKKGAEDEKPEVEDVESKGGSEASTPSVNSEDRRGQVSAMLGYLKYRANPLTNKSGENLTQSQQALKAHVFQLTSLSPKSTDSLLFH